MSSAIPPPLLSELLEQSTSLQVSTINPDGSPHLATVWYGLLDGDIAFWTQRNSRKVANLRRDPRLACLVDAGTTYAELRGASIGGEAELVEDLDRLVAVGRAVLERNYPPERRPDADARARDGTRVGVIVHPTSVSTWDFRPRGGASPGPKYVRWHEPGDDG